MIKFQTSFTQKKTLSLPTTPSARRGASLGFFLSPPGCPLHLSVIYSNVTVVTSMVKAITTRKKIEQDRKCKLFSPELRLLLRVYYHHTDGPTSLLTKRPEVILGLPCH